MPMILTTVFFIMQLLANYVFRPDLSWEDSKQNDQIEFINDSDTAKSEKNMKIGKTVDDPTRDDIIQFIQKRWD